MSQAVTAAKNVLQWLANLVGENTARIATATTGGTNREKAFCRLSIRYVVNRHRNAFNAREDANYFPFTLTDDHQWSLINRSRTDDQQASRGGKVVTSAPALTQTMKRMIP